MRDAWGPLIALLALVGCDSLHKVKSENPVFPAAPPRISLSNDAQREAASRVAKADDRAASDAGRVVPVGLTAGEDGKKNTLGLDSSEVVATVNGQPIFASEVLDRYAVQLAPAQKQASPEEFQQLRESLFRRDLPGHIERKLLVQSLRSTLKPEQIKLLQTHLDRQFEEEVDRMKKQLKVETRADVDAKLAEQQTSLETLKTVFINQRMAMEYLVAKSKYDRRIGRRELYDYYLLHESDYSSPALVKWQQIVVLYSKHGGREKSRAIAQEALDELADGADFADVAKKRSDGPTKANGGLWDWMRGGSLEDENVEATLFEIPVGEVSGLLEGGKGWQVVKVLDRRPAGVKPFEELQDEIRQKVEQEARREASQKMLVELREGALVESEYVEPKKK